jgi:hypothetical protein
MTSEDERRARALQRGRDYINSEAGAATAEALGALLDALEKDREANSDDARKRAHEQALASRAALEAATGVLGWRRRRIVSTAAGLPAHRHVATAKGIEAIFTRRGHITEQRFAAGRILIDEVGALLGGRPENLEAATLILAEMGYHSPQGELGKDSGIRGATIRQGVNPDDGPSAMARLSLYTALGYTLGAEGKRACSPSAWKQRAALHLRAIGPKPRPGPKPRRKQPTVGLAEAERVVAAAWAYIDDQSKDRDPDAGRELLPVQPFGFAP